MLKNRPDDFGHGLANKLTPTRVRLEKFLLDYSDGRMNDKSDHEILKEAIEHIQETIAQIDDILC